MIVFSKIYNTNDTGINTFINSEYKRAVQSGGTYSPSLRKKELELIKGANIVMSDLQKYVMYAKENSERIKKNVEDMSKIDKLLKKRNGKVS